MYTGRARPGRSRVPELLCANCHNWRPIFFTRGCLVRPGGTPLAAARPASASPKLAPAGTAPPWPQPVCQWAPVARGPAPLMPLSGPRPLLMPGTLPVGFGDYQQQPEHRTRSTSGSHTEATEQHHVDRTRIIQIDSTLMAKSGRVGLTCGATSGLTARLL